MPLCGEVLASFIKNIVSEDCERNENKSELIMIIYLSSYKAFLNSQKYSELKVIKMFHTAPYVEKPKIIFLVYNVLM